MSRIANIPEPIDPESLNVSASPAQAAPPTAPEGFANQPPMRLNDGFMRQEQPSQPDVLFDDEAMKKAAMDPRGSREIAPYGSYQAVDQALSNGYYTGLEALDFGTLPDGTPAALFTDQKGQRQAIRLTTEQWFAALQQRAEGRIQMAQSIRRQQEAKRLSAPVEAMARELEEYAPGFSEYAALGLERDPNGTYVAVQRYYDRVKANDRDAIAEMRQQADQTQLSVAQGLADNWATSTGENYALMQRGFVEDQSIPEEVRAQRVAQIKRWQMNANRFALLAPPAAGVRRVASFPSFYFSQSDPGALDDLADMAIQTVGYDNVMGMGQNQRIPMLVQQAQRLTRDIGWSKPFSQADIDIVSQVMADRLARAPRVQVQPDMAQMGQFERAGVRGGVSEMRSGEAQRRYETQMQEAKLQGERARASRTGAEAEFKQAETAAMRGAVGGEQAPSAGAAPVLPSQAIADLSRAGIEVPEGVDPLAYLADTAESLARSASPSDKARLAALYRIVQQYRNR